MGMGRSMCMAAIRLLPTVTASQENSKVAFIACLWDKNVVSGVAETFPIPAGGFRAPKKQVRPWLRFQKSRWWMSRQSNRR